MKKIVVLFYAYKSKELKKSIDSLVMNHSKNTDLEIHIYDRNNMHRSKYFYDIRYNHIVWDSTESNFTFRDEFADSVSGDYIFIIQGSKTFSKDWDTELINLLDNNEVISGNHAIDFINENHKFFATYKKEIINKKTLTNWIDPSFIFTSFDIFKKMPSLAKLKYHGEQEVLSAYCFANNIKIFGISTNFIIELDDPIYKQDYIPFSLNHNYNYVIDMFKGKENIFFNDFLNIEKFEENLKYNFSKLSYHPFPANDIEYSTETSIDDLDGERFFGGINSIY